MDQAAAERETLGEGMMSNLRTMSVDHMQAIPGLAQTQAPLNDQLLDLIEVAQRLGMYDAADYLKDRLGLR